MTAITCFQFLANTRSGYAPWLCNSFMILACPYFTSYDDDDLYQQRMLEVYVRTEAMHSNDATHL